MLPLPLALKRFLDLSISVAGASASRMLADLGAEVIVIERRERVSNPGRRARLQRNKLSCTLDFSAQEGRDLVLRLAAECDAVVLDEADAALQEAGLDHAAFESARSDIVIVSIGEGSELPGLGTVAAAAAMTALCHKRTSGEGQLVTVSFPEAQASMLTLPIVAAAAGAAMTGPDLPPSGCYACKDGSLALVVRSEAQLAALGEVVGRPEAVDLVSGGAELQPAVAAWAAGLSRTDAANRLRAAGVPAQTLLSPEELTQDPHLRARGLFEPVAAGETVVEMDGPRFRFQRTPAHVRFPAPAPGAHDAYVLRDLLGLSEAEVDALRTSGVVGRGASGAE
ncbi:MAG TPA: CoA transferase [Dehalococcoidia bacterium]|nr:CoA transferase [Dehalococcoidia bacterium]